MTPSVELDRTLRCFVPAIIEERVQAGQTGSWVSEHRKLVSVFMKINGLGPKPCEVSDLAKASQVCGIVQERMQHFDGTITRLICDDKGTRFLIAFGLPSHAHEDDESRAVVSCLQVVDALSRIKPVLPAGVLPDDEDYQAMNICVGITTGKVFCGEAGSEGVRVEYTLSGARVNLAARLMQAAGNTREKGILCDKDTYDAVVQLGSCDFKVLDPIKVKGKEELVPIFRPLLHSGIRPSRGGPEHRSSVVSGGMEYRSSTASTAPVVSDSDLHGSMHRSSLRARSTEVGGAKRLKRTLGREMELTLLRRGLEELGVGKGGVILLLGEAGMGKTHLAEVLRSMHERRLLGQKDEKDGEQGMMVEGEQINLFHISSKQIEDTTPFFPWKGVFEKLFTRRTLETIVAETRQVKPPPPTSQAAEDAPSTPRAPAPALASPVEWQVLLAGEYNSYEPEINERLESALMAGKPEVIVTISGKDYRVTLQGAMRQVLVSEPTCTRKVRRLVHAPGAPKLQRESNSNGSFNYRRASSKNIVRAALNVSLPSEPGSCSSRTAVEVTPRIEATPRSRWAKALDSLSKDGGAPAREQPAPMKPLSKSKTGLRGLIGGAVGPSVRPKELAQDAGAAPSAPAGGKKGVAGVAGVAGPSPVGGRGSRDALYAAEAAAAAVAGKQGTSTANRVASFKRSGTEGVRQRWRDALSSVLAFLSPSYAFEGRHCVRPSADDALLADESFVMLAPLLSPVLPIQIKDNEVTKHLMGETRMAATIRLMVRVLAAKLGEGRPILIFEDVHWMDSSSWTVLRHALEVVKPMLVLLTLRQMPEPVRPAAYDEIVKEHKLCETAVRELPGLSVKELRELLCEAMGVAVIQEDVFPLLAEKTNGNPFWVLEFLKSMIDSNLLEVVDGACRLTVSIDQVKLPSSVESLITSRMDRLPASQQLLMKMGAVMGTVFKTTELGFLGEQSELDFSTDKKELIRLLDMLVSAEMLQRVPGQRNTLPVYRFKHKYLQDVSYSLLPEERKEKLHYAAAEYYEGGEYYGGEYHGGGGGGKDLVWKLSYHWSHAGDSTHALGKAVHYLTQAGDAALDNLEARKLLLDALRLASRKPELAPKRGPLQRRMAQTYLGVGETDAARQSLSEAIVSLGGEKDRGDNKEHPDGFKGMTDADFRWRYRRVRMQHSIRELFMREPKRKHSSTDKHGDTHPRMELAVAYELLSEVLMQEHQREQAGYCAMRALMLGCSIGTLSPVVGRAYASLCLIESAAEKSSAWTVRRYKRKALETCEQLGELGQLSYTLLAAGVLDAGQARWEMATDNLARSASISEQLRDMRQWEQAICHQAHLEYYRGNFIRSKELYEKALASAEGRFDQQIRNRCKAGIAATLLATNNLKGAIAILNSTNSYGQLALALLRSGQSQEAFERAMRVKDRFKGRSTKYYVLKAFASTAEVILELLKGALTREGAGSTSERSMRERPMRADRSSRGSVRRWGSHSPVRATKFGSGRSTTGERDSVMFVDSVFIIADEEEKPRFDDLVTLEFVAKEWMVKLEQFGNIYPVAKPRALLLKGIFFAIQPNNPAAKKKGLKLLRESQMSSHALQMPYDEALATYELAIYGDASPAVRLRLLQAAYEDFKARGAQYDSERCAQQIRKLEQADRSGAVAGIFGPLRGADAELEDIDEVDEVDEEGTFLSSGMSSSSSAEQLVAAADATVAIKPTNGFTAAGFDRVRDMGTVPPPSTSSEPSAPAPFETPVALLASLFKGGLKGGSDVPPIASQPKWSPLFGALPPTSPKDGRSRSETRKRGQGAGTEGCSMGCGSEPNDAPTAVKVDNRASTQGEPMHARSTSEDTSASRRARVPNGLVAPQRQVTFSEEQAKPMGSRRANDSQWTGAHGEAPRAAPVPDGDDMNC